MPLHRRAYLAALRLLLLFVLLLAQLYAVGQALAEVRDARTGLGGPLPSAQAHPFLGIHVDLHQYTPFQQRRVAHRLAASGFEWARIRLDWSRIEPEPGRRQWQQADVMVAALLEAGLTPVLLLDGSPVWARAEVDRTTRTGALAPPADPADFAAYAAAVAARYGDRVRYYQLWDEPNIAPHWGARHIEPVAYAQLLKAGAAAVRSMDDDAFILTAALAPTTDRGHTAIDEPSYLRRLYAAGAATSFDAVAVQPFGFGATPGDSAHLARRLTWQRIRLVRQVMIEAGDGAKPLWVARMGWNVRADSRWGTVTPAHQIAYTLAAVEMAYGHWPWVAAVGWAVDQPAVSLGDPWWGFALNDGLAASLRAWQAARPARPQPAPVDIPFPPELWSGLLGLGVIVWRGARAARLIPWHALRRAYLARAWTVRAGMWALVLLVYYLATWAPLIVVCWGALALLMAAQPRGGLMLVLALLPFHHYHKELAWAGTLWAIPPAQAALLCLLPGALGRAKALLRGGQDGWAWVAAVWVGVAFLAMPSVWHWPAYLQGMVELVWVPVVLFLLVRRAARQPAGARDLATGLALGGVLAALAGLVEWLGGGGTPADGLRRLVGPTFSPNHTALYLERTLFLLVGLAGVTRGTRRWTVLLAAAITSVALVLTGSRGALLLGLPAGAALWLVFAARDGARSRRVGLLVAGAVLAVLLVVLGGMLDRLFNRATLGARWETWQTAGRMVAEFPLAGVGPGGFTWTYPAYLPPGYPTEPNLRHPHQVWLELATSGGVAALLWFGWVLRRMARLRPPLPEQARLLWAGAAAGLVAGLAHAQVDAFQALPDLAAWNWCALALLVAGQAKAAAPEDSGSRADG